MFDIGWTEMLMIAVVVIVVVGPRDLPKVLRTTGRWVASARSVAREFHRSLDQIAEEAELDEIKKGVEQATSFKPGQALEKTVDSMTDPTGSDSGLLDQGPAAAKEAGAADEKNPTAPATKEAPGDQPAQQDEAAAKRQVGS